MLDGPFEDLDDAVKHLGVHVASGDPRPLPIRQERYSTKLGINA